MDYELVRFVAQKGGKTNNKSSPWAATIFHYAIVFRITARSVRRLDVNGTGTYGM
ncbi:hypothetical protein [Metabacillus sp. Hm71]|uniref:hypothetical protein n=1 Tax=Metabacillus sp. Hm71 TaxID=3450743 RepID=UPI003F41DC37